jgi:heme O synthase-like polyprenyltransferase
MKTTAIPVSRLQSPSGSRLAARLPDFVTLTKPRVMALAVFTALVGMIIAPGHLDPLLGSIAVLAIAAGAGAAGVLNMWCDADIDAVMTRCPPPRSSSTARMDGKRITNLEPAKLPGGAPSSLVLRADAAPGQVR